MNAHDARPLAARILGDLPNYHDMSRHTDLSPGILQGIELSVGEIGLGIYQNIPQEREGAILVTNQGLHLRSGARWMSFPYHEIRAIKGPQTKEEISGLTVRLADDRETLIPICGAQGNFRDAFPFMRFLMRVTGIP